MKYLYPYSGDGSENTVSTTRQAAIYKADGLAERIIIPGLKAVIVSVTCGLLVGLLIGAFQIKVNVWYAMAITALAVFLAVFLSTSRRGQWLVERLVGADLNGDTFIGQPDQQMLPAPAERITVEVVQESGRRGDILDLPIDREKLTALASGLTQGRQFAQSVWTGNGAVFTRSEFEATRTALITAGLLTWNKDGHPSQGVRVTPAGRAIFRRLAGQHPPTTDE